MIILFMYKPFIKFFRFYGISVDRAIKTMPKCPIILVHQENDVQVWNNIDTFIDNFKCARLQGSNYYDTFVVKISKNTKKIYLAIYFIS
jgi:hypothetical protein